MVWVFQWIFIFCIMNAHDESIQIASDAPEKANKELTNIDEDIKENRDTVIL